MFNLEELTNSITEGEVAKAAEITQKALTAKVPAKEVLDKGLLPAMNRVGSDFESGEIFLPELLMAGDAMKASIELLRPELVSTGAGYAGKYIIGTVEGDLHDIGKNIVSILLRGAGYIVKDLGNDVEPQAIVEAVKAEKPQFVGLSALLTSTMVHMGETIEALKESGLRDTVRVVIGGAPVSEDFARSIGADGYGADGFQAMTVVESLSAA